MIEVEIRAKVHDFGPIKAKLQELGAEFVVKENQADYIFGRDKDLDKEHKIIEGCFVARIREKGEKRLVEFKEIRRTGAGLEFSSPLPSLGAGLAFLEKLDFKKAFAVCKDREIYKYRDFEICLDEVEVLGKFIEVEHSDKQGEDKEKALSECKEFLGLIAPEAVLEPRKYGDLMQNIINKQKQS